MTPSQPPPPPPPTPPHTPPPHPPPPKKKKLINSFRFLFKSGKPKSFCYHGVCFEKQSVQKSTESVAHLLIMQSITILKRMITNVLFTLKQSSFIPFLQVFRANRDQNSLVLGLFSPSIKARYIRVHPQTWNVHISMRIELLGCPIGNNYCLYN